MMQNFDDLFNHHFGDVKNDNITGEMPPEECVTITYKNYRGETSVRKVRPFLVQFTATEYYPKEQWILHAYDLSKRQFRSFAMANISGWVAS